MVEPVIEVSDLVVRYRKRLALGAVAAPAVDGISFRLEAGETLGIVGESGSGKSTILRAILRLAPVESGRVCLDGQDWLALPEAEMRRRRARLGVVAQNPFLSLSPRLTVARILAEPMLAEGRLGRAEIAQRAESLLAQCGLPGDFLARRASELSGGQAQRVAIARALALDPALLILDEPTSALDVSVQAQILNLIDDLKERRGLSMLMVTHDLGVVRHMADRLLVMRQGREVEQGLTEAIIAAPVDPYTRQLIHGQATTPATNPGGHDA